MSSTRILEEVNRLLELVLVDAFNRSMARAERDDADLPSPPSSKALNE